MEGGGVKDLPQEKEVGLRPVEEFLPKLVKVPNKKARTQISTRTRFEVFKRDGFTCVYCGGTPPGALLHVDHIVAVKNGGANDLDNLATSCSRCNQGKAAKPLTDVPQGLKDRAAEVAEREAQIKGYQVVLQGKRDRLEDEMWRVAEELWPGSGERGAQRSFLRSIKLFIERLGLDEVLGAAEITIAKCRTTSRYQQFRYFCAVCWNKIKGPDRAE